MFFKLKKTHKFPWCHHTRKTPNQLLKYLFGFRVVAHYWWWINLWKIWIDFVKIKFHFNETIEWHCMQLEFNPIPIELNAIQQDSNSIEEKWDAKWWNMYWKFTYEYGVGKK